MHIITRGIGKQILFEEEQDYRHYLTALERYSRETGARICAYCLMENHVHLLVHASPDCIVQLMKKLGVNYAGYYNWKYEHVGHLFQDRYISEPVETSGYLFSVFRYILRNPEKAGICRASEYRWSSFQLYDNPPDYMELDLFHTQFGTFEQYQAFIDTDNNDTCLEYEKTVRDDLWARSVLQKELGIQSGTELQQYDKKARDAALALLRSKGLSVRQIERLTGINRNIVQRASCNGME